MIKIRYYRERMGFTMKELAQRVGCTESAISNYELGKREASYETLLRIAETLETDVSHLLGKEDEDSEVAEYLEELRTRPEMRMLFESSKGMTKEQINAVVAMLEGFKK